MMNQTEADSLAAYEEARKRRDMERAAEKPSTVASNTVWAAHQIEDDMEKSEGWQLKRTRQCAKCPWRKDVDPRDIPNGYCEAKHRNLASTIAEPGAINLGPIPAMACHETDDAHCIGWLANQLGAGNNIGLRLRMMTCKNADRIRLIGEQHENFEDTLP